MAPPRNNDRHSSQTGTIPKTKVRNNYNVPQEVVTPTRRDMSSNLVSVRNMSVKQIGICNIVTPR